METAKVEIFSNRTNAAVIRHPNRAFPGLLVQGDTLHMLHEMAEAACRGVRRSSPRFAEVSDLRDALHSFLSHYSAVLNQHDIPLPFSDEELRFSNRASFEKIP